MTGPFGERLRAAMSRCGPLCAGIDPHSSVLCDWGLPDTAAGARELGLAVLDAVDGRVAAVKPQSAFFERFGATGIAALEEILSDARRRGIITILDAKRGDIGSTMAAYSAGVLRTGAPMEADALTVSPYLGFGSLTPAIDDCRAHNKGVFVLCLTSNPDGPEVQHAVRSGSSTARTIAERAAALNRAPSGEGAEPGQWGSVGLVIGATVGEAVQNLGIDLDAVNGPILAPGFGAQGAGPEQLRTVFGAAASRVLVSMSRSLLSAGPDARRIAEACEAARAEYAL